MKLLLIQLSDIHFKVDDNSALEKKVALVNSIRNPCRTADKVILVISGDVAYSGNAEEYKIAKQFIEFLLKEIDNYCKIKIGLVIIPGNHDCDFSNAENKARNSIINLIQQTGEDAIDKSVITLCTSVQENYRTFIRSLDASKNLPYEIIYANSILKVVKFAFDDYTIIFNCYNTAYLSQLKEQPGRMYFPITKYDNSIFENTGNLLIGLFHHPTHWFTPNNRREFVSHINNFTNFYLTGHEHISSKSLNEDLEGNYTYHIEGDVLQDSEDGNNSGFNLIYFNLKDEQFVTRRFSYQDKIYRTNDSLYKWTKYSRSTPKILNQFELKDEFISFLNDPGASFAHPYKSQLKLLDIYTYPRFRVIDLNEYKEKDVRIENIDSESLISDFKINSKVLLSGEENIGKTSFCKMVFKNTHQNGLFPIYIDGRVIKETSLDEFKRLVSNSYKLQYKNFDENFLEQLSVDKIIIIVDDFDKAKLNIKYRGNLIRTLNSFYSNIFLIGSELFSLMEIVSQDNSENLFQGFVQYEFLEFGYVLKGKLINKWNILGRKDMLSDEERFRLNENAENIMNTVIGNNFVPNYPLFLLIILQAMETSNPHELQASSYGHYYQFLIYKSLSKVLKVQQDFNTYYNYLSDLAYCFFQKKLKTITLEDFEEFHISYKKEYGIRLPMTAMLNSLKESQIVDYYDNKIEFKYLYTYYYFVAKKLARDISQSETKEIISALCLRLYRSEFANIFIFLTHHSKDDFILDEIMKSAKNLFSEFEPIKLENDISVINNLAEKLPEMVLKNKRIDQSREEENKRKDEVSSQKKKNDSEKEASLDEDENAIDIIGKLNISFKTIEIIGQILKNGYGDIKAPLKLKLLEEAYATGLRTLNLLFDYIQSNADFFINQIRSSLEEHNIDDDEKNKIDNVSKRILFGLCAQISFGFLKKISDSVGTETLVDSYEQLLENNESNARSLIDFSIRLDHFRKFPEKQMKLLKEKTSQYPLSYYMVKRFVLRHLYLFHTDFRDKQKICAFLGISMDAQRSIEVQSKDSRKDRKTK